MRKKIVAGNWKMNTLPAEGVELANNLLHTALFRAPYARSKPSHLRAWSY